MFMLPSSNIPLTGVFDVATRIKNSFYTCCKFTFQSSVELIYITTVCIYEFYTWIEVDNYKPIDTYQLSLQWKFAGLQNVSYR